jgi:uncharacterized membrane protein (UPF0182 family)
MLFMQSKKPKNIYLYSGIIFVIFWLIFSLVSYLFVEQLWFKEVGYLETFIKRIGTETGLFIFGSGISGLFIWFNFKLANRYQWIYGEQENPQKIQSPPLKLSILLPIVIFFGIIIASMLIYYGQVSLDFWQPRLSIPHYQPFIPSPFRILSLQEILTEISERISLLLLIVIIIVGIVVKSKLFLNLIGAVISLIFGFLIAGNWTRILSSFFASDFDRLDPLYQNDIGFYIFKLPVLQLLDFWLGGLGLYTLLACSLIYLVSGNSLSEGKFPGFSDQQIKHLYGLTAICLLLLSFRHWLSRYELLYSKLGVIYGASYTNVNIERHIYTFLTYSSLLVASLLLGVILTKKRFRHFQQKWQSVKVLKLTFAYLIVVLISMTPAKLIQIFYVQPNELEVERTYIERAIAMTRSAFSLDTINAKVFDPEDTLTAEDIARNHLTIDNIRLWDTRPLLQTNRQLQQIRLYYKFFDADIDRYNLIKENQVDLTEKQQVIISARELDYDAVPEQAKTWVNKHLVYTHGYGFTVSPVNQVEESGLPRYFVKDIGTGTGEAERGKLYTSSPTIAKSIPTENPRIYYGELTNNYIMTSTKVQEFDFPSGEENVYNTYSGDGGINIKSGWKRLALAQYFQDWRLFLTQNFTPETKILLRRNINARVQSIAPFLYYDKNPYLVAVDTGTNNYLNWIIDAYTTSEHYPYSDPGSYDFNYIRNSVKVVINAYNGDTTFYITDPEDPIIKTWRKIFPELFKPLSEMPVNLKAHIRYPLDLFEVQSERLLTYHMTDPQVFYNREDQWEIPQEVYASEYQPIEPYYLIMKLPIATGEEFILLHPYTPTSRPNLVAWLAARSDGENYGKLLLYQFPKQRLIYGPNQIEALINQDPIISQQISLWDRQGSKAIQGNLLVIPIDQSLLYVEPLYIEAEQNSLPILARVIVVYENQIVMSPTLRESLEAIFEPEKRHDSAIIRELREQNLIFNP